MSPTLNGSSVIRCFNHSNALEIRDGITFDFYTGLAKFVKMYITGRLTVWISLFFNHSCELNLKLYIHVACVTWCSLVHSRLA